MRIIELPSFFPPYGGEFCLDQAKALHQRGHDVTILSVVQLGVRIEGWQFLMKGWGERRYEMEGVPVWQRFTHGIPKMIRPNVKHWISVCVSMIDRYVRECGKPDVIHAHCCKWAGVAARVASRKHGVPYVITDHLAMQLLTDEFALTGGDNSWEIPMLRDAYNDARLVMPVSRELAYDMMPVFGEQFRWREQSNMIDTAFYSFRQRRSVADDAPLRILCLARFTPLKGYDVLFDALQKVNDSEQITLHIAGRATDSRECAEMIEQYGLTNVEVHGLLDKEKVRALLYHCDALVLPTRAEVHPLVVLEAISSGIPAIITEACPKHTLPEGSYIPVTLSTIADGLLTIREFLKTYDAAAASAHIAETLSMEAIGRSIERNISDAINGNY